MIYLQLLWVYLKIGMFGFGGGYAMLSLIQHEIVDIHHWLTPQQFTDVVAISQMTPGPIGINSATYVGYAVTQSVWGAVLATVAVCLPSFILVLLISYFFAKCKDNKYIKAAMSGLLPMSVALIASAALLMMNRENFMDYKSIGIFAAAFWVTSLPCAGISTTAVLQPLWHEDDAERRRFLCLVVCKEICEVY